MSKRTKEFKRLLADGSPAIDGTPVWMWSRTLHKYKRGVLALVVLVDDEQEVDDPRFWKPRATKRRA